MLFYVRLSPAVAAILDFWSAQKLAVCIGSSIINGIHEPSFLSNRQVVQEKDIFKTCFPTGSWDTAMLDFG